MKIFKMILAANEVRGVDISGQYFELRKALYAVDVELLTKDGGIVSLLPSATESDYTREGAFQKVVITNGAIAQTVEFWHGFGDAGSRRFSGNVSGSVDLNAATLAALESVDLNAATIAQLIGAKYNVRPEQETGFFSNDAALVANTPLTVFAPASNPNGAILLTADIQFQAADYTYQVFIAKNAAPATVKDGAVMCGTIIQALPASVFGGGQLPAPVFIKPGDGLYFVGNYATIVAIANNRSCRYRLL